MTRFPERLEIAELGTVLERALAADPAARLDVAQLRGQLAELQSARNSPSAESKRADDTLTTARVRVL